ncbi:hypothetical protein Tco_0806446 [Tanacetum coccineum]
MMIIGCVVNIFDCGLIEYGAKIVDESHQAINTIAGDKEDPDVKDKQENQEDPNIAIPDQVLEESIFHTSDKVEAVLTSMVVDPFLTDLT